MVQTEKAQRPSAGVNVRSKTIGDEVQRLIWDSLDGTISQGKAKVLNGMLERSKPARQAYVEAVEEHFGIVDMFR